MLLKYGAIFMKSNNALVNGNYLDISTIAHMTSSVFDNAFVTEAGLFLNPSY